MRNRFVSERRIYVHVKRDGGFIRIVYRSFIPSESFIYFHTLYFNFVIPCFYREIKIEVFLILEIHGKK